MNISGKRRGTAGWQKCVSLDLWKHREEQFYAKKSS